MGIFSKENILLNENLKSKDEVLKKLADLSCKLGISDSSEEVYAAYLAREKTSSTGMVNNFAIPHAKSSAIKKAQVLMLRNNEDIGDWETLDDSKVRVVISILIPEENSQEHLKILANISRKLMKKENIDLLKGSESEDEIVDFFSKVNE